MLLCAFSFFTFQAHPNVRLVEMVFAEKNCRQALLTHEGELLTAEMTVNVGVTDEREVMSQILRKRRRE